MNKQDFVDRLDELLIPLGFERPQLGRFAVQRRRFRGLDPGPTWNRKSGEFIDAINLQQASYAEKFVINTGVVHPRIHFECWGMNPGLIVYEVDCTVRARVSRSKPEGEFWFDLDDREAVGVALLRLEAHISAFLDCMHSLASMEAFLEEPTKQKRLYPPEATYLASIKWARGDEAGAIEVLDKLLIGLLPPKRKRGWRFGALRVLDGIIDCFFNIVLLRSSWESRIKDLRRRWVDQRLKG